MIKLKEILFLKNLKRVGKATIYGKYWKMLNDADDFYDLVSEVELNSNFTTDEIKKAMFKSEELYGDIFNSDMEVITVFDEDYPKKLEVMGNKRPLALYIKGNADALKKTNISVIGTRNPSKLSEQFEKTVVKSILDSSDIVIVSGLALGCDKIAHQTTVDENKTTIAVLPSGVNVIKPSRHKKLAQKIIETGGCLVSEYEPNVTPYKKEYVERDKIVAAFSDAIFVVECGVKSGTMHTVNAAFDYNKQVYVYLPDERSENSYDGNEFILKENANAISVEDIGEFLENLDTLKIKKVSKTSEPTLFDF